MCGRAACTLDPATLCALFGVTARWRNCDTVKTPNYNTCPGQRVPVLRMAPREATEPADAASAGGPACLTLSAMRWGLTPHWVTREGAPGTFMVNARSEGIAEKRSFRSLLSSHRCAVVVDGYYEWKQEGSKLRVPYYFYATATATASQCATESSPSKLASGSAATPPSPLILAGLYDTWRNADGELVDTVTVITVAAPPPLRAVHDRMPAVLDAALLDVWLSADVAVADALALLVPRADLLQFHAVGGAVTRTTNTGPECIAPLLALDSAATTAAPHSSGKQTTLNWGGTGRSQAPAAAATATASIFAAPTCPALPASSPPRLLAPASPTRPAQAELELSAGDYAAEIPAYLLSPFDSAAADADAGWQSDFDESGDGPSHASDSDNDNGNGNDNDNDNDHDHDVLAAATPATQRQATARRGLSADPIEEVDNDDAGEDSDAVPPVPGRKRSALPRRVAKRVHV